MRDYDSGGEITLMRHAHDERARGHARCLCSSKSWAVKLELDRAVTRAGDFDVTRTNATFARAERLDRGFLGGPSSRQPAHTCDTIGCAHRVRNLCRRVAPVEILLPEALDRLGHFPHIHEVQTDC